MVREGRAYLASLVWEIFLSKGRLARTKVGSAEHDRRYFTACRCFQSRCCFHYVVPLEVGGIRGVFGLESEYSLVSTDGTDAMVGQCDKDNYEINQTRYREEDADQGQRFRILYIRKSIVKDKTHL